MLIIRLERRETMVDETEDKDLDAFLDKIKNEYKDGWTENNWEEVSYNI